LSRSAAARPGARLSVRSTILLLAAATILLVASIALYVAVYLGPTAARLGQDSESFVAELAHLSEQAAYVETTLSDLQTVLHDEDAGSLPDSRALLRKLGAGSRAISASVALGRIPPDVRLALAAAADQETRVVAEIGAAIRLAQQGDWHTARQRLNDADSLAAIYVAQVHRAEYAGMRMLNDRQAVLVQLSADLHRMAPLWVGLVLLMAVVTFLSLEYRVTRPLARLDAALREVAGGRLDLRLSEDLGDEMGRLNSQFNRTVEMLERTTNEAAQRASTLEYRLGRILEDSADEVFLIDAASGRLLEVNRRAARNLGYDPAELAHKDMAGLLASADVDLERGIFQPLVRGETEQTTFSGRLRRRDGSTYPVEMRFSYGAEQEPPVFLAVGSDRTEAQRHEERLRQAQKMEAVGQLTGGIAHDFNNLLTVVQGNLELLRYESPTPAQEELIGNAQKAVERGAALTGHLLAFARRQPLAPVTVDVNLLVGNMLNLLQRTLGEGLEIRIDLTSDLWACNADPRQIENVLLNLTLNARDAMEGKGVLTIATSNVNVSDAEARQDDLDPGPYVTLSVADTGTGIAPQDLPRVFEPFFTTKEVRKGSGLGLAMVYGFARQSAGHVKIWSEVGVGTRVTVYLPRSEAAADEPRPVKVERPAEPRGEGRRILLVEDDPQVRELAERQLLGLGYQVTVADCGEAGLDALDAHDDIDLVLSDIVLPGDLNGREMVERARERRPGLKAVYMSGYSRDVVISQGRLDEGIVLIQKPFDRAALARTLAERLRA
jgi:PAS domain S-box-containing protein